MYRCLANAAGTLSRALQFVSDELQDLADASSHRPPPADVEPNANPGRSPPLSFSSPGTDDDDSHKWSSLSSSSVGKMDARQGTTTPSPAAVKTVCAWLKATGLHTWLPLFQSSCTTTERTAACDWLSSLWCPPLSESAYHSLTYSVGASSVFLSRAEKIMANAAATQLGLPSRFLWPAPPTASAPAILPGARGVRNEGGAGGSGSSNLRSSSLVHSGTSMAVRDTPAPTPANTTAMLWPTAMRTATGQTVPRPSSASSTCISCVAALPALPSTTTAGQIFAPAPRAHVKTSAASSSLVATSPRSARSPPAEDASTGGGVVFSSRLEAYLVLLHTARTQALTRSAGQHNVLAGQEASARQLGKLVLYAGDQVDPLLLRAAQLIGIPHLRVLQTVAGDRPLPLASGGRTGEKNAVVHHYNYTVDVAQLQARVVEDVAAGLYPVMVVGTFGSGLSGAVDPVAALGEFCKKLGVWYHLDASHGGNALLATPCHTDRTSVASVTAAAEASSTGQQWIAFAKEFQRAALTADSVVVAAGSSALPYSPLRASGLGAAVRGGNDATLAGAALLFVAHVRKVAWSVQCLGQSRQSTFNQHRTPAVSDSDVLRLSPLAHSCSWLASHAIPKVESNACAPQVQTADLFSSNARGRLARRVAWHQHFTSAVLHAVRSDGRFDASLDAALFGMVRLRWLTAADEATSELARAWAAIVVNDATREVALRGNEDGAAELAEAPTAPVGGSEHPPVQMHIGVVQLQRRVWMTLSFGELNCFACSGEDAASGVVKNDTGKGAEEDYNEAALAMKGAVEYVLRTLDLAARRVKPEDTQRNPI